MAKKICDISKWQGDVDWAKAAGELDFVILRASCGLNTDDKIACNIAECNAKSIRFGTYHYLMAQTVSRAKEEAEVYYKSHGGITPCFFVCDVEYGPLLYANGTKIPMNPNAPAIIAAFVKRLRELGAKKIGYYGGQSIVSGTYDIASDKKTGAAWDFIWIAMYGANDGTVSKSPTISCDLHQFTSRGSLSGVSGNVDLNRLTGSKPISFFTTGAPTSAQPVDTGDTEKGGITMSYDPKKVLDLAASEIGYLEKASNAQLDSKTANAGSKNYTKYARDLDAISGFYNGRKQGFAWCDVFVDWLFVTAYGVTAALALLCQPKKSCGAGCRYSRNYYKAKGQLYDSPKAGDQIFFWPSNRSDPNAVAHTGIVEKTDSTYVYTIEGNTSGASGVIANGGGVCRKKYKLGYARIAGYGRPNYGVAAETPTQPVEPVKLGGRTLSKGDEGSDVSELQTALVKLGYDLGTYGAKKDGVDGDYGNMTKKAVMTLQEKHGLTETGIFDTAAYNALLEDLNPETPPAADDPDTSTITYVLTIYGDEDTLRAIQKDHGGTLAEADTVTMA